MTAPYWSDGDISESVFEIAIRVVAANDTGDESYELVALIDDTANMSNDPIEVARLTVPRGYAGILRMTVVPSALFDSGHPSPDRWLALITIVGGSARASITRLGSPESADGVTADHTGAVLKAKPGLSN